MRIEPGSATRSPSPTSCSKKIAAIGVTYSWLNRMSVTTNPSSPGLTAGTPILPRDGSTTQWRAMIFSPSVIGRRDVAGGASTTLPWSRATLKLNSPPYSMMPRVISPSPSVKAASGIASPRRTRSMIEKSVVVRTPRFWQFSR